MHISAALLLSTLASLTLAQQRCQMFVNRPKNTNPLSTPPDIGEIRQGCLGVSSDKSLTEPANCITMGTFPITFDGDITIAKGNTGLPEDVTVRIFNDELREGFLKYKTQDLNFENFTLCKTTEDGSLNFNVVQVQCDFDCP